jgi:hypothetical protein
MRAGSSSRVVVDRKRTEKGVENLFETVRKKGSLIGQGGGCSFVIAAGVMVLSGLEAPA